MPNLPAAVRTTPGRGAAVADGMAAPPVEAAYQDIVQLAALVCGTSAASLALFEGGEAWFQASQGLASEVAPRSESLCALAMRRGDHIIEIHDLLGDPDVPLRPLGADGEPLRFYAAVPVLGADDASLGTLCVLDPVPRLLTAAQRDGLAALARQVRHLLQLRAEDGQHQRLLQQRDEEARQLVSARDELQRRHDDLEHVASHDPLTGLLNRAALRRLRTQPEALRRIEVAGYAVGVVDIDFFKQVNDRHGHLLGDRALRAVADTITACIRQDDVAVRYGGEEFLLVLPSTSLAGAFEVAERIRVQCLAIALPLALSVSIGLAAGDPALDTPEEVFERADQALYRAKAGGRNRVVADDTLRPVR